MKIEMLVMLVIVALFCAVVVALFAWAVTKSKNARKAVRRMRRMFQLLPLLFTGWGRAMRTGDRCFANIGEGTHEHGLKSYIPDAGTNSRYLLYEIGSVADNCRVAAGVNEPLGPSDDQADANNLDLPIAIKLLGAVKGTLRMTTDGTCVNGGRVAVKLDGSGYVTDITAAAAGHTYWVVGKAIIPTDAVVVAGDPIEVVPFTPYTVAK